MLVRQPKQLLLQSQLQALFRERAPSLLAPFVKQCAEVAQTISEKLSLLTITQVSAMLLQVHPQTELDTEHHYREGEVPRVMIRQDLVLKALGSAVQQQLYVEERLGQISKD